MRTEGSFTTAATVERLLTLLDAPEQLERLPMLRDVSRDRAGDLAMVFTVTTSLGPVPLSTTVTHVASAPGRVDLLVRGRRGSQFVDVTLAVHLRPTGPGCTVAWTADLAVRGVAASVGQRVAKDIATRAIGDLLAAASTAAQD